MSSPDAADAVQVAVVELLGMADMYKRMQDSCWTKCIANVKEAAMSAGESSCVDRCVSKYGDVHAFVGQRLQDAMEKDSTSGRM